MENPLELPVPPENDSIKRIEHFARDLAYGAINGFWGSEIQATAYGNGSVKWIIPHGDNQAFWKYLKEKWNSSSPRPDLMLSFQFFQAIGQDVFILTPKAFGLLEKPITPPSVFISYKQSESSALALLIESRLKNIDPNVSIFIDKNIPSGESINTQIAEALEASQFFICLLGSRTLLDSTAVQTEIDLVKSKTERMIIPICHNGYTPDDIYTQYFGDNKAIVIKHPESAEEYEINMTRLLIRLGYSTT
jgi:hypothetical protein